MTDASKGGITNTNTVSIYFGDTFWCFIYMQLYFPGVTEVSASCGLHDCDYQCGKEQWQGLVRRVSTHDWRSTSFWVYT